MTELEYLTMLNDIYNNAFITKAKGDALSYHGATYGIKRRLFGLEPDFIYRKRLLKLIILIVNDNTSDVNIKNNRVMNWLNRVKCG